LYPPIRAIPLFLYITPVRSTSQHRDKGNKDTESTRVLPEEPVPRFGEPGWWGQDRAQGTLALHVNLPRCRQPAFPAYVR
ncbi:hypothetical protein BOTBODRAFT_63191, partial [Botryobasidium botryosum FD-172 SS1]